MSDGPFPSTHPAALRAQGSPARPARLAALALAASLLCNSVAHADEPPRLATAPLALQSADGLQRLALPLAALQASRRADWGDVWIVDAQGRALPQAWAGAPPPAKPGERWIALPLFAWPRDLPATDADTRNALKLQIDTSGAVVRIDRAPTAAPAGPQAWLIDLHDWRSAPSRLRLSWPADAHGLRRQARVWASDDAQHWRDAGSAELIEAPSTTAAPFLQREIAIDTGTASTRYLRLALDRPLAVASVEALRIEPAVPAAGLQVLKLTMRSVPAPTGMAAAWEADLGGPVPVERIQVHLPQPNWVLPLEFSWKPMEPPGRTAARNADDGWRFAASHTAHSLQRDGRAGASAAFEVHTPPARRWLAVTRDASSAGGDAPALSLGWRAPQLVFAAHGAQPLHLQVGSVPKAAQRLDLATLIPGYAPGGEHALPQAQAGSFDTRPLPDAGLDEADPQARKRWLLWGVLGVAVLVLAAMARRLMAEVNAGKDAERKAGRDA